MKKLEYKHAFIAITPLLLITFLVMIYDHSVKTYFNCVKNNCESIASNLKNILVADDPTTYEIIPGDTNEVQRKKSIKKHEHTAARYSGRITWLFLRLVYTIICVIAFAVACGVIYKSFAYKGKHAIALVLAAIALSAGFGIYLYKNPELYMSVFISLFEGRIEHDLKNIKELMVQLNSFGFAVVLSVVLAVCAILYSPNSDSSPSGLKQLSTKMKYLQSILYVGTIMLISGVLLIRSIYHWSLAFTLRDDQAIKNAESFFSNLLAAEGGFFTLVLAAIYLPTALILRRRADTLAGLPEQSLDKEKLLKDYNLTFSFTESLPRLLAILGPLLAGPIGELLSRLSK